MKESYQARLPDAVRLRAQGLGASGKLWLSTLDETVRYLEDRWDIQADEVHTGGSESLVINARLNGGADAVVKIGLPGSADLSAEAKVYDLAAGRGYASLFGHERDLNAILLERLGSSLGVSTQTIDTQMKVICGTLEKAWIGIDGSHGFMSGVEKARWLAEFISEQWELLNKPCERLVIERALDYIDERIDAHSPSTCVLVHGDAHAHNTLLPRSSNDLAQCRFVDPDGLFAEKACDLAVLMRDWSTPLLQGDTINLGRARAARLSDLTGVAEQGIWQWGYVERVSTSFVLLSIGMIEEGQDMLRVAGVFAGGPR